jgi:hypothetical protein
MRRLVVNDGTIQCIRWENSPQGDAAWGDESKENAEKMCRTESMGKKEGGKMENPDDSSLDVA